MISHVLPQMIELADRVVVMRQGSRVGDLARAEVLMGVLVRMIVGAEISEIRAAVENPDAG